MPRSPWLSSDRGPITPFRRVLGYRAISMAMGKTTWCISPHQTTCIPGSPTAMARSPWVSSDPGPITAFRRVLGYRAISMAMGKTTWCISPHQTTCIPGSPTAMAPSNVGFFRPWTHYGIQAGFWDAGDFDGDGKTDLIHFTESDYVHPWLSR